MKKLLIALGLGSALLITPALAQTDQTAPPAGASAPAGDTMQKPMKHKAHKAHHKASHAMKKSKKPMAPPPADQTAPKS